MPPPCPSPSSLVPNELASQRDQRPRLIFEVGGCPQPTDWAPSSPKPLPLFPPGWWFDACGLSNLNGIYYPARHHVRKLNGIRWHYFQGPSYSLRATRMMVRPTGI